jgi:hypothetical protein
MKLELTAVLFSVLLTFSFTFAKDMTLGTDYYNFSLYSIGTLMTVPTQCDEYARNDVNMEWICANYPQGYEAFIGNWEAIVASEIIKSTYQITPISDWVYFNDTDRSIDFYAKAYTFNTTTMLVAYDPSEQGREIFLGVGSLISSMMANASGVLNMNPLSASTPSTTVIGSYNCEDFNGQEEAQAFFDSNGFSNDYDPYNLDANNNNIVCEVIGETVEDGSQCPPGESWVDPYVRSDGVQVKGHCRKRR